MIIERMWRRWATTSDTFGLIQQPRPRLSWLLSGFAWRLGGEGRKLLARTPEDPQGLSGVFLTPDLW
jgi:hypothetical protein